MKDNQGIHDIDSTLGLNSSKQRKRRWLGVALLIACALFIVAALALFSDSEDTGPGYRTAPVQRGDLTLSVTATGTLQPLNQVEVGSELSGTIASVEVDFNDEIREGQVLARLDTSTLETRVVEGKASLQSAVAKVREAEATEQELKAALDRCRELAKQQMCSPNEVDAAVAAYERAKSSVASAEAQVSLARAVLEGYQSNLKKALIRSPINGIVLDRNVEPGQTVAASFQTPVLFTLAEDLTNMEMAVAVDEADIGLVRNGLAASFSVDAYPERIFEAQVRQIHLAPQTVDGVVSYETVLAVDNSDLVLLPGMTATAEIIVQTVRDALLIPNAALRFSPPAAETRARTGGIMRMLFPRPHRSAEESRADKAPRGEKRVWLLEQDTPRAVSVKVGASDGNMTVMLSGPLKAGDALIVEALSEGR